ncbi:cysteine and histidine-rich protein 1-like [Melopsittacus undulatus]|uniref:cysteine and histidine-rich protein 1-like n=1 Tax=Melopsittacus undulatus TaxID=13146 RepID=UPI00146CC081|nr:cysteine and histidine-rich protein 1-like [Melopsittacus undulatus]
MQEKMSKATENLYYEDAAAAGADPAVGAEGVNDSERNPNLSCKRMLSFQLILKSKVNSPLECSFLLLEGPYDDVSIRPVIYHLVCSNESNETEYLALPIADSVECNKLLAAKNINLRLFLFQIQK